MESTPLIKDPAESEELDLEGAYSLVYNELRRLAAYYMRQERSNHTLQPTALVHETFLRLVRQKNQVFLSRTQFISIATNMMRRILVDHAIHRHRQKRDGDLVRVTFDRAGNEFAENELDLLELDEALNHLSKNDQRAGRVFELRFFGGLTFEEVAEVLKISPATTKREWKFATLFLQREMFDKR